MCVFFLFIFVQLIQTHKESNHSILVAILRTCCLNLRQNAFVNDWQHRNKFQRLCHSFVATTSWKREKRRSEQQYTIKRTTSSNLISVRACDIRRAHLWTWLEHWKTALVAVCVFHYIFDGVLYSFMCLRCICGARLAVSSPSFSFFLINLICCLIAFLTN